MTLLIHTFEFHVINKLDEFQRNFLWERELGTPKTFTDWIGVVSSPSKKGGQEVWFFLCVLSNVCFLQCEECVGFWVCITFFIPLWNGHCSNKGLCSYSPLGSYFCHSSFFRWACWPYWPTGLITSFLGLPRPTYFIFTSYSSHQPVGCHSYHVDSLGLLPLFLGFFSRLTLSLPLILSIGLLDVILAMLTHWVY